ncbi:hypothetical protein JCM8097_005611 [Rhodosporidiobolus ruineniae]
MATATSAAKPLAQHPTFPLSPVALSRWIRFARKGGIGTALARVDRASEDSERDLMMLEGDSVVVLMELGREEYLGYCEGVVGLFHGQDVTMQQPKLKRPVISSRPPSSSAVPSSTSAPAPPAPKLLPRAATSLDLRSSASTSSSGATAPSSSSRPSSPTRRPSLQSSQSSPSKPAPSPSKRLSRSSSFDYGLSHLALALGDKPLPVPGAGQRRKPVPEVEVLAERFDEAVRTASPARRKRESAGAGAGAGLGIDGVAGGLMRGEGERTEGRRRSRSVSESSSTGSGPVLPSASSTRSPALAGAFSSVPLTLLTRRRPSVSSSTSTAELDSRTPSLITSPFSDRSQDDPASSSETGSAGGSAYLGPLAPEQSDLGVDQAGKGESEADVVEYLAPSRFGGFGAYGVQGYPPPTPTATMDKFPLPRQPGSRFPPSAALKEAPTPYSSPAVGEPSRRVETPERLAEAQEGDGVPPPTPTKDYPPSLSRSGSSASLASTQQFQQPHSHALRSQLSFDTLSSFPSATTGAGAPPPSASTRAPSHILGPSALPLPAPLLFDSLNPHQQQQQQSAFSFSPQSSLVSSLPDSVFSAGEFYNPSSRPSRRTKTSTSTVSSTLSSGATTPAGSGAGAYTPGEDPTLAFIFDSYRYTPSLHSLHSQQPSVAGSVAGSARASPVKTRSAAAGYFQQEEEEGEVADQKEEEEEEGGRRAREWGAFGAATQLRDRIRLGEVPPSSSSSAAQRAGGLDEPGEEDAGAEDFALRIPHLSAIFPRSTTDDSLVSVVSASTSVSASTADEPLAALVWGLTARLRHDLDRTPTRSYTLPTPSSPSPSPAAARPARSRQQSVPAALPLSSSSSPSPASPATSLAADLAASRRLFEQHFGAPPAELLDAAVAAGALPGAMSGADEGEGVRSRVVIREGEEGDEGEQRYGSGERVGLGLHGGEKEPRRAGGGGLAGAAVPQLEVYGASPPPPHGTTYSSLPLHHPLSPILPLPYSPSPSSYQTFASAPSSPFLDCSDAASVPSAPSTEPSPALPPNATPSPSTSSFSASSSAAPNKLRKNPSSRLRSSPSVPNFASPPAAGASDPFVVGAGVGGASVPSSPSPHKLSHGLFSRRRNGSVSHSHHTHSPSLTSPSSASSPVLNRDPARRVDYSASAGISNKDFEEETVRVGKEAFEMVKPLAVALLGAEEGGEAEAEPRASTATTTMTGEGSSDSHTTSATDPYAASRPSGDFGPGHGLGFATPRRPPAPLHSASTPRGLPDASRSALSLSTPHVFAPHPGAQSQSHFSPATPSSVEDAGRSALSEHRAKEQKWLAVLSGGMSAAQVRKSKKLRALVHSGLPSSVRGKVWAFLAGAEGGEGAKEREGVYSALCNFDRGKPTNPAVQYDLDTMLFDHPQFAPGTVGRDDLEVVLAAFARYDPQLGYYPGLVNVVALLLTQMPAESAFWSLCALVKNKADPAGGGYGFRQFFPSGKEEMRLECLAFGFLLEASEPKLAKRLRDLSISPADYLPLWHSTLFLSILPLPTALRLVDLLLFDPKTRHRAPLALLDLAHLEDTALSPTRDAVLNYLVAPPPEAFAPQLLVPAIATVKVSDDRLKKAYKKAAQAMLKPR